MWIEKWTETTAKKTPLEIIVLDYGNIMCRLFYYFHPVSYNEHCSTAFVSMEQFQVWLCEITCKRLAYETEELLFLYILRARHTMLWREALRRGCVIVAPRSASLGAERCVSSAEAEAHVLVPRREVEGPACEDDGSFVPLRGDARSGVSIVGSELVASGPIYQGGRRVRIVGIEEVGVHGNVERKSFLSGAPSWAFAGDVDPSAVAVRVLRVSMPLVGGIPAPDEIDELDASHVSKCVALLRSAPELEGTFREIDAFTSDVALARSRCLRYAISSRIPTSSE